MTARSAIYAGQVVHTRLAPKRHAFAYKVFALLLDVDELRSLSGRLRLFSYNRRGALSLHDRDHGARDGASVAEHARATLAAAGLAAASARISLLCYPRVFGFVFNPLSVYFCHARDGRLGAIIYEVTNTFGERTSYVIAVASDRSEPGAVIWQSCRKGMYVSPFIAATAHYDFHVRPPGAAIVVGVDVRDGDGPVLKTHFRGTQHPLTDAVLATMLLRHPLMTLKVIVGIHSEAARLWWKGVPIVKHQRAPSYAVQIVEPSRTVARHA